MNKAKPTKLNLMIHEIDNGDEQTDKTTLSLMKRLREFEIISIERPTSDLSPTGTRGDAFTIGALTLVVMPAVLPSLIEFLSRYAGEQRHIEVESNGRRISFTAERQYTEEEILDLVKKLEQV
jgi:hypothetical protein